MNKPKDMSDPRNTSFTDFPYNNTPMNLSTPTPQYNFPSMFPSPYFPVNSSLQFPPMNIPGIPNQQNFSSQPLQQPDGRPEMPKVNQSAPLDIEAMQNMMRMLNQKMSSQYQPQQTNPFQSPTNQFQSPTNQFQSPMSQMQSPSNPTDFMNFANSMMMAQQMMSQMSGSQPKFELPTPSLASNVGELFNKNVSNLQNFYSMLANTNPNLADQRMKGLQIPDPRNVSKSPDFQRKQETFGDANDLLNKSSKFDVKFGDKFGSKFPDQDQFFPPKKTNQQLNDFEGLNYRRSGSPEGGADRNGRRTKQYADVEIEEEYPEDSPRGTYNSQGSQALRKDNRSFEDQNARKKGVGSSLDYIEADERPIKSSGAYNFDDPYGSQGALNERNREEPPRPKNPFDDVPVGGKGKKFEEILEEQLRKNPGESRPKSSKPKTDSSEPKNFLKKKSRPFLSSAANRTHKPADEGGKGSETHDVVSPNNANPQTMPFPSKNTRNEGKPTEKGHAQPQTKYSEPTENDDYSKPSDGKGQSKPPRRFLAKGGGTGGGKGMNSSQESFSKAGQRAESEENTRSNFYDDRDRYQPTLEKSQSQERIGKASKNRENSRFVKDDSPTTDRGRAGIDDANDSIIKEKIETLNSEIAKFKLENERVKKIRQRHEDMLRNLNRDIEEFEMRKLQFEREVEQSREDNSSKSKKERKTFDKKRENEENDFLRQQLTDAQADFSAKEQQYKAIIDRLKKQVEDLTFQNNELLQELKARGPGTNQPDSKYTAAMSKPLGRDNAMEHIVEEEEENQEDEDDYQKRKFRQAGGKSPAGQKNAVKASPGGNKGGQSPYHDKSGVKGENEEIKMRLLKRRIQENEFKFEENPFYKRYLETRNFTSKLVNQTSSNDGKIQKVYEDGKKEVIFQNGVKREIFPDGYTIVHFMNKDIKQTLPDGTVIYFFAEANTTQTTLTTGTNIFRFANNQVEFHNTDSTREIHFADGTKKFINNNGEETTIFTDGTVQRVGADKIKYIEFANGQKDIVYVDGSKIRTYPDGRVKKYNANGKIEE